MNRRIEDYEQNGRQSPRATRAQRNDGSQDAYRGGALGASHDDGSDEPGWRQSRYETSRYAEDRGIDRGYERGFAQPQQEYRRAGAREDAGYGYGQGYGYRSEQDWDTRAAGGYGHDYGREGSNLYGRDYGREETSQHWRDRDLPQAARNHSRSGSRYEVEAAWRGRSEFGSSQGRYGGAEYGRSPGPGHYGPNYDQGLGYRNDYPVQRGNDYGGERRYDYSEGDDYRADRFGSVRPNASPSYGVPQGQHARSGHAGRGPKGYTRSDERLKEDISERLTDDPYVDASDITIEVRSGKVTLSGQVEQRWTKHHVEDLVDRCSGVQEIDNKLSVSRSRQGDNDGYGARSGATSARSTTVSEASTKKQ